MTFTSKGLDRRTFLAGGLATLSLPLLLSACSPSGGSSGNPNSLRIAWWGGEARTAKMNEILDLYSQQSELTFRSEFAAYDAYWERFATQAAAGNLPDIMGMTEQQVGEFASGLHDMLPAVESGDLDLSTWDQRYVDAGMVDGRLVQLFLGGTIPSLGYNSAALAAAGFDDDPNEWSWQEFFDNCVQMSNGLGDSAWATGDGGGVSQQFDTFLLQKGKLTIDGSDLGWEPSDLEEYLTAWAELRDAGGTPPIDVTVEYQSAPFEDTLIVRDQLVFQIVNHNHVPVLQAYVDDELRSTTLPVFDGGERAAVNAGTYVSLAETSPGHENALAFLSWFVNDPEPITIFQAEYGGLPSPDATAILAPEVTDAARRGLEFYDSVADFAQIRPVWPQGGIQLIQLVRQANEAVAYGATPAEAAASCFEQSTAAIA